MPKEIDESLNETFAAHEKLNARINAILNRPKIYSCECREAFFNAMLKHADNRLKGIPSEEPTLDKIPQCQRK